MVVEVANDRLIDVTVFRYSYGSSFRGPIRVTVSLALGAGCARIRSRQCGFRAPVRTWLAVLKSPALSPISVSGRLRQGSPTR